MKRIVFVLAVLFCSVAFAATETINWYMDGNTYATTTCTTGGDITLPTTPIKKGYTFQGWFYKYVFIEYLESTGTQWIDTGFSDPLGVYIKIDAQYTNFDSNYNCIAGAETEGQRHARNVCIYEHNGSWWYGVGHSAGAITGISSDTNRHIFYSNTTQNAWIKIDGTKIFSVTNSDPRTNDTISLFGSKGSFDNTLSQAKIYSVQLYDHENILVRDFIPVLDKNGTPCLYDKVTNQFFYNQGTGNFIAGPIVQ